MVEQEGRALEWTAYACFVFVIMGLLIVLVVGGSVSILTSLAGLGLAAIWILRVQQRKWLRLSERDHDETRLRVALDELEMQRDAMNQTAIVTTTDVRGTITYANDRFCAISGYTLEELIGKNHRILKSDEHSPDFFKKMWRTISSGEVFRGEVKNKRKDGGFYWVHATIVPFTDTDGKPYQYVAIRFDISERKQAEANLLRTTRELVLSHRAEEAARIALQEDLAERKRLETDLVQAQKLEAVGQLAAGIAHEINTPIQYVGDNTRFLEESFSELIPMLNKTRELLASIRKEDDSSALAEELAEAVEDADIDFLVEEIPKSISQSLEGIERVRTIVLSMKEFSHPDTDSMIHLDLNHAIENTISVSTNEWKYVADVQTDLDPELPAVPCLPGEFNQVILNLIVNAAHAIGDAPDRGSTGKGTITIRTRKMNETAVISISDNGTGIPLDVRHKIFDQFFTTKNVGKGTGQGLGIAHRIVVDKHGGTIDFWSEIGKGTTFFVRLPLAVQIVEGEVALEAST